MGFPLSLADEPGLKRMLAEGRAVECTPALAAAEDKATRKLVAPVFAILAGSPTWVLPIVTVSESNSREDWAKKSNRTRAARRTVSLAFGRELATVARYADAFHSGQMLAVVLTRLGGRKLDKSNLPSALKATEDAVALMLGADDGAANWHLVPQQQTGGPAGVRIELKLLADLLVNGGGRM